MELPKFKYHPDPVASGSIAASDKSCSCCKKARGYFYTSHTYCEDDLEDEICPWCIADGSAAKKYEASFSDSNGFDDGIPSQAAEEIEFRTPGFDAWQTERWLACCGDAMAFLEPIGAAEFRARYPLLEGTLMTYIVQDMGISGSAATRLLQSLDRDKGPTAYVFGCLHCDAKNAYIDLL